MKHNFKKIVDPNKQHSLSNFEAITKAERENKNLKKISGNQTAVQVTFYNKKDTKSGLTHDFDLILEVINKGAVAVAHELRSMPNQNGRTVSELTLLVNVGLRSITGLNSWYYNDYMYSHPDQYKEYFRPLVISHLSHLKNREKGSPGFELFKIWDSLNHVEQRRIYKDLYERKKWVEEI